jgi:hypothetical protein
MHKLILLLLILFCALPVTAQGPSADWQTIRTPHFRVHYPIEYAEWATRAAGRLESIREVVSAEIGFTPPQVIDVLVINPIAQPNGSAWPLLDTPRMIFYTEPPLPDDQIGAYGHWIDLLAVHETAHLVHMLRPSRNPMQRLLERSVFPFNPITLRGPRWITEGYATVIEGRITGTGRPSSTIRALILRRWAETGRLPSYAQLNSNRQFLGMSMAYLMGSAFLEWLEERHGPDSLRHLWARMTARQRRSFPEAFAGVFGDRPERMYGRFVAELTASAMALERATEYREGELFQETPRASGDPAVSPDGTQLAVVIRDREKPQRLVIWQTGPAEEEEKRFTERLERILARDPEDVAPVRARPLPRKERHSLTMPDGGDIDSPRWTHDGTRIIFGHRMPDREGFLHYDLFEWTPATGSLRRVTRLADVRSADPMPDGRTAVAVRSRYGTSELVTVDLTTGAVTPRSDASIDVVYTHPRISPDGGRLAHVEHRDRRWRLVVDGREIPLPGDPATPEWLSPDEVIVTVFSRGFAELYRVSLDGTATAVTRTAGGAFTPAPSSDGRLFFMSLNPDGRVVRVLPELSPAPALPEIDASLIPAIPPPTSEGVAFETREVSSRPYGIGRQEPAWLMSQNYASGQRSLEIGARLGDVVGRLNTLVLASLASGDLPDGAALATAWRGWPVTIGAHVYTTDEDDGIELRGSWSQVRPLARLSLSAGALDDELFADGAFSTWQAAGTSRFDQRLEIGIHESLYRLSGSAGFRRGGLRLGARYDHAGGGDFALGGLPSSLLPRSAYAARILDPALPVALLSGERYDGIRVETKLPGIPFTAFYQRHEIDATRLSLAGGEIALSSSALPILKMPGLDLTLGAAYLFDAPREGDTNFWLGMRWRP